MRLGAVEPLGRTARWEEGEIPETYRFAVSTAAVDGAARSARIQAAGALPGVATCRGREARGGGTNIFGSLKQSWTSVSWEQVVAAQPTRVGGVVPCAGVHSEDTVQRLVDGRAVRRVSTAGRRWCGVIEA
jgi:hypothetical protein